MLRSDFLVHWTGKDLKDRDIEECRREYVLRLENTLKPKEKGGGLWLSFLEEKILSRGVTLTYGAYGTCFTETKLSESRKHAEQYGQMGFGFTRDFVLSRRGGPVFYFRNHKDDERLTHFFYIRGFLMALIPLATADQRIRAAKVFFQTENLDKESELMVSDATQCLARYEDYFRAFGGIFKNMSNPTDSETPEDYAYLEENEWRINETPQNHGHLYTFNKEDYNAQKTGAMRIPFTQKDLRLLVFPDKETKRLAWQNASIHNWLTSQVEDMPALLTLEDCDHF